MAVRAERRRGQADPADPPARERERHATGVGRLAWSRIPWRHVRRHRGRDAADSRPGHGAPRDSRTVLHGRVLPDPAVDVELLRHPRRRRRYDPAPRDAGPARLDRSDDDSPRVRSRPPPLLQRQHDVVLPGHEPAPGRAVYRPLCGRARPRRLRRRSRTSTRPFSAGTLTFKRARGRRARRRDPGCLGDVDRSRRPPATPARGRRSTSRQDPDDPTLWTGIATGISNPANVHFLVQAVNGVGKVTVDDNLGAFYRPGSIPGPPGPNDAAAHRDDARLHLAAARHGPVRRQLLRHGEADRGREPAGWARPFASVSAAPASRRRRTQTVR